MSSIMDDLKSEGESIGTCEDVELTLILVFVGPR